MKDDLASSTMNPVTAIEYAGFVDVAYRMFEENPGVLSPPQPEYFPTGWKLLTNIVMTDFFLKETQQTFYGFYAVNCSDSPERGEVVVAIRGTKTAEEWWDDCDFGLVDCRVLPGFANPGMVADGFQRIYESFSIIAPGSKSTPVKVGSVLKPVAGLDLTAADLKVTVAGHSLGSALATLFAADIATHGAQFSIYTFASPRVGNPDFVHAYNSLIRSDANPAAPILGNYRVWNEPDVVPKVPKDPLHGGYAHVAGGYEVDSLEYLKVIKMSIGCFHSLATYVYCLGDHDKVKLGDCAR